MIVSWMKKIKNHTKWGGKLEYNQTKAFNNIYLAMKLQFTDWAIRTKNWGYIARLYTIIENDKLNMNWILKTEKPSI